MGSEGIINYLKKYKLPLPSSLAKILKSYPGKYFEEFINKNN